MIKKILIFDSPLLREKAKKVNKIDSSVCKLVENLKDTLQEHNALGLASNQIGILKRIIVIRKNSKIIEMINPVIVWKKGKISMMEECLSLPGKSYTINRAREIKVIAKNVNNKIFTFQTKNLMAIVIQHEIDHLNGILIGD